MPVVTEDQWIDTRHGQLFARSWTPEAGGPGLAPIVLFHDSLGCVTLWREFPERLAQATGRRVLAYDRLGFGLSPAHPGGWGLDFVQQEALQYFPPVKAALGLERFVAFGHSIGGAMAASCAAHHPQACEAVITLAAQGFVEQRTTDGISQARDLYRQPEQLERLAKYHGAKARWVLNAWTETWLDPAFARWTLASTAPQLNCPLLVMHGSEDEYGSLRHPERITEASADARMLVLEGCHHLPHREAPEQVLSATARFLAETGCMSKT